MPFVTRGARRLFYETQGSYGDPVVLIHGSFVDHRTWDRVMPGLAQGFQVLRYDRRGHGESTPAPRPHPVADDAADLAEILEETDQFPAHLVAHSYGGAVAVHLAAHRSELVRSLSLHEPPFLGLLRPGEPHAAEATVAIEGIRELQRLVRGGRPEEAARRFVDRFSLEDGAWNRLSPALQERFVRNAPLWAEELDDPEATAPREAEVSELLLPVLLTVGEESPRLLRYISEALAAALPYPQVVSLPECGHLPHLTRPDLYVGVLGTFLLERNVPPT